MMKCKDYLNQILAFNGGEDVIALREKFDRPSFFEIISKERSETTYSAFLKWMFQENCPKSTCNPLALLLDVLVRRSEEQASVDTVLSNEIVKRAIVTRNLKIRSIKVETEKPVSNLAKAIIVNPTMVAGELSERDLETVAAKSKDKIDLFVDCEIDSEDNCLLAKRLHVVIENKIDSAEGGRKSEKNAIGIGRYDNATQTQRYYLGSKFSQCDADGKHYGIERLDVLQVYVYLSPHVPCKDACPDNHFIQISYQDIVDSILMPMLASSSLPMRSRFFLEEFLNQLVFPSLEGSMVLPSIAVGRENSKELTNIWTNSNYQPLLTHAAIAASEVNFWMVDGVYYDHQPREELLEALLAKGVQSPDIIDGKWKRGMHFDKMRDLASQHRIEACQVDLALEDDTQELLSSFWMKNQRLLTAVINGMDETERVKALALLTQLSKRDTTRYDVFYGNVALNKTPLGSAQAALAIICKWISIQKVEKKAVTLDILNKTFPRACNPYYDGGQWFSQLFYEVAGSYNYDGEKADGPVLGNWDFDKKGRFDIETTDGKRVTMLKMWRKESLEALVKWVKEKKLFSESLDIVPVE